MARVIQAAAAQMGPISRSETRRDTVGRLIALMREARGRGAELVVFTELALTTFFPRWLIEDEAELDSFFEREMPGPETMPLFEEAKRLGIGFYLGYAELIQEAGTKHRFNTSILVDRSGSTVGKYRKVHLPGHAEPQPGRKHQHLEKRYFEPGNLGFGVWRAFDGVMGMCICNDRRWPETYRVMGLQGVELVMLGYNTPYDHTGFADIDALTNFHNHLSMQAGAYQNSTWVVGTAKCGNEEGSQMVGQSVIIAPSGEIVAQAVSLEDEIITARCDLDLGTRYRNTIFDFAKHREPQAYRLITERKGAEPPRSKGLGPAEPRIVDKRLQRENDMAKEIICAFGTDIDSVAGQIGSYGGGDSPSDIQRGVFASEVGNIRLLKMFKKYGLTTTFFIPGHSIESFPDQVKRIVDKGHEIGAHGYLHENPIAMTPTQEEDVLAKSVDLIDKLSGQKPRGYVAPWWEMSESTVALLQKYGFKYDHSQGYRDFQPFYARVGDKWNLIDYSKTAAEWMHPMQHGKEIDLVEIGANWYVDDLPPMMFMKKVPNSHGFVNPRDIEELWRDQFDYVYREMDYAVFAFTIHPDVSGRPQVILMLERLIEYINGHNGVKWMTFEQIAEDFRKRFPFSGSARPEVL